MNDLTAEEIVMLVKLISALPEGTMIFHENTLYTLESHPIAQSLFEKIEATAEREDVKELLDTLDGGNSN